MRAIANLPAIKIHISAGGNAAFISLPQDQLAALARVLREQGLSGILLRGNGALWLGRIERPKIAQAVKQALDAENRFPSLDE